ncbi:MAG: ornithine carbamoyltransferase [Gammaproteobacteria bacterium]|nr:ornithine carbamoyltransferase [Gammaproteobacteria bacterium]
MSINLRGRHFLTLEDFSSQEIEYLLQLSYDLKEKKRSGIKGDTLFEKSIVLIFDKPSTRTRCAFEVGAHDEGASVTFLSDSHMGHKESIEDTAKVLGRMFDGIEFRGFDHKIVKTLADNAGIPVWNGLTDQYHPTQILADFLTIREKLSKPLNKVKLVFAGDARNNMGNSLMIGAAKMGMHFVGLAPKSLFPNPDLVNNMRKVAKETDATIDFSDNINDAVKDADVIYTDVWVSMGEEDKFAERIKCLSPYQVNKAMLDKTGNPDILFMHCLPAFHDTHTEVGQKIAKQFGLKEMEVTDKVFRSRHSVVFDQAENRLHTIKAVMVATIGNL